MKTFTDGFRRAALLGGAGLFALMAPGVLGIDIDPGPGGPVVRMADGPTAQAAAPGGRGAHGSGGKHLGGRKGAGHKGKGSQHDPESGHEGGGGKSHVPGAAGSEHEHEDQADTEHEGTHEGKGGKGGQGGHGAAHDSDPGAAGHESGGRGGAPAWAKGGIPEVELGRLNVARSPGHVIQRALDEALANWDGTMAALYESTAESAADTLAGAYATTPRIDSPLQNLGLYKDLLANRQTALPGVTPASVLDLAAIFLGSASDKSIPIGTDSVTALNTIFGLSLTADETAALAAKADKVRAGILAGHGE
ncbi:MAG: hypothetical protein H6907_17230 [Hyphomicrobiales bacterium]|nr:hypothetical protein [Hyphomicrobiales bacterium]